MRKYFNLRLQVLAFLIATAIVVSCNNNRDGLPEKITTDLVNIPASAEGLKDTEKLPVFEFETNTFDFGVITQGEKKPYSFKFKNTGASALIITSAKGSCGCTVPAYPKKPIPPGGEGVIDVVFDSDGKSGNQNRSVTVLANTYPATTVLTLTGQVVAPNIGN